MTQWKWTARNCYLQLRAVGVTLSLSGSDKLKIRAPADLDLGPMVPVIQKYKPGLIRFLRQQSGRRPK